MITAHISRHYELLHDAKEHNISVMMTSWDGGGNRWDP
jgi:hypothetical protein